MSNNDFVKVGYAMGYTFTPDERIENILHALESLQERLHNSNTPHQVMWTTAIEVQLENLNDAILDMRPNEVVEKTE